MAGRPCLDPEVRDARKRARARAKCRRWMARYPEIRMLEAGRKRARERGTPCTITRADIQIPEKCPILGIPLLRARAGPVPQIAAHPWTVSIRTSAMF